MSDDQITADQSEVVATAAVVSDGAYTLFVADFAEASIAWQAYEALKWSRMAVASRSKASSW